VSFVLAASCAATQRTQTRDGLVDAGDAKIFVHVWGEGSGTPLVLIPGGPGVTHHIFAPLGVLAGSGRPVAAFDLRGPGRSSRPPPNAYGLARLVADVEAVRAVLGAERIHLAGSSWGGMIAMAYAGAHPDRLASLIFLASIPPRPEQLTEAETQHVVPRQKELARLGLIPSHPPDCDGENCTDVFAAMLPLYFADPRHPLAGARRKESSWANVHFTTRGAKLLADGVGQPDLSATVAAYTGRALVLEGDGDFLGTQVADQIEAALLHARVTKVILPGCGHMLWDECPAAFFAAMRSFLDTQ
jgi:proline iminopeptidase